MAKKKRGAKSVVKAAPPKNATRHRAKRLPSTNERPSPRPPTAALHCYRHEVGAHPHHAPLTVDLDISAGRGPSPAVPGFVGFTAEIADDRWPDQFAFRIVSLHERRVRVTITRVDRGLEELAWGANLVVHVLVVDRLLP